MDVPISNTILVYAVRDGNIIHSINGLWRENNEDKKITVEVPEDLLNRAINASGKGITPTVRKALELVVSSGVYAELRHQKGNVHFSIRLSDLRRD